MVVLKLVAKYLSTKKPLFDLHVRTLKAILLILVLLLIVILHLMISMIISRSFVTRVTINSRCMYEMAI